jgi:hypothetical protein
MTKSDTQNKPAVGLVLIAGAGLGAWVWQDVTKALTASSLAISFPEGESRKSMSLDDYTKAALEQIKAWHNVDRYVRRRTFDWRYHCDAACSFIKRPGCWSNHYRSSYPKKWWLIFFRLCHFHKT